MVQLQSLVMAESSEGVGVTFVFSGLLYYKRDKQANKEDNSDRLKVRT